MLKEDKMMSYIQEGDIIIGSKRKRNQAYHPIIYLGERDTDFFEGGMITHSEKYGNVKLEDSHFIQNIVKDKRPSYLVRNYLLKKQEWGPFHVVGKLSQEGIEYIRECLNGTEPLIWEDYLN